jgi:hypothetical protein
MQAVTLEECSQPFGDKSQIEGIKISRRKLLYLMVFLIEEPQAGIYHCLIVRGTSKP